MGCQKIKGTLNLFFLGIILIFFKNNLLNKKNFFFSFYPNIKNKMKRLSSIDVLNILREYKLEKKPIRVKESYIYFNNNKFPLNTETGT